MTATIYIAGLDLGQAQDFTALAVLERIELVSEPGVTNGCMGRTFTIPSGPSGPVNGKAPKHERHYAVRHLERFGLGTSYPVVVERVVQLFGKPPLAGSTLAVDQTGVGRAVVDMLVKARPRATIRPITITAGQAVVSDGAGWHVPKKELVGVLQVLLQSRRLQVARALPHAAALVKELESFRVKVSVATAHETFESWRERDHDDLVLAVAMAAWVGERGLRAFWVR